MSEHLKASDLTILLICVCFSFYLLIRLNIGGSSLSEMDFWDSIILMEVPISTINPVWGGFLGDIKIIDLGMITFAGFIVVLALGSSLVPRGLQGFGLVVYAIICSLVFIITSVIFGRIPYIGVFLGPLFATLAMVILYFDVSSKLAEAG